MTSWRGFSRAKDFSVEGDSIFVRFDNDRSHRVFVVNEGGELVIRARVAPPSLVYRLSQKTAENPSDVRGIMWERNAAAALVGFRIDRRGWLVGEAVLPRTGLTASEFQTYVRAVAVESDRFEYALTGRNRE